MPRSLWRRADRVDDDAGRVQRSRLVLQVGGTSPKHATLEAHIGPLGVVGARRHSPTGRCGRCGHRRRHRRANPRGWRSRPGVLEIFLDSGGSRSSMFLKSMLPPTLSWWVRSSATRRGPRRAWPSREFNTHQRTGALAWNRPREVHLGHSPDPDTRFPGPRNLPTSDAGHDHRPIPTHPRNLVGRPGFDTGELNGVWTSDITYLATR